MIDCKIMAKLRVKRSFYYLVTFIVPRYKTLDLRYTLLYIYVFTKEELALQNASFSTYLTFVTAINFSLERYHDIKLRELSLNCPSQLLLMFLIDINIKTFSKVKITENKCQARICSCFKELHLVRYSAFCNTALINLVK